jgi:SAM-dependent methyltransferase
MASGYAEALVSFRSRFDLDEKFNILLETAFEDEPCPELYEAKRCLALGAGAGLREITFIKRLMPNLRSFTAVEPDEGSVAKLKANLQLHVPDVETTVHKKTVREFFDQDDDTQQSYDVVLILHVLYYINDADRRLLRAKLFDGILRSGGLIVAEHAGPGASGDTGDYIRLVDRLGPSHVVPYWTVVAEEFLAIGLQEYRKFAYDTFFDYSNPDDSLKKILSAFMRRSLSIDEISAAVRCVCPNDKGSTPVAVTIFRKP